MNALILAAGIGSRLGAITKDFPKVLLPINNQPLLDIIIKKLLYLNFEKIIVNTFFHAKLVENYLAQQNYHNNIIISREEKLLGTAGTLKFNLQYLDSDDFLVMHGDNYFSDNLLNMLNFHKSDSSVSLMTMGTFPTDSPEQCGIVEVGKDNFINSFYEKVPNAPSNQANSAIYLFKKQATTIIQSLSPKENDISKHLIPKFIGLCKAYELSGNFIDIGTPDRYKLAQSIAFQKTNK